MQSIDFDDGFRSYAINGDESRVIRINVTDLNTKKRFDEASSVIGQMVDGIKEGELSEKRLEEADRVIREQLDHVFGKGVCETAFGMTNVLSAVESGGLLIEGFLNALMPVVRRDMENAAEAAKHSLEERTAKYVSPVAENTQMPDVDSMSTSQKQALLDELTRELS